MNFLFNDKWLGSSWNSLKGAVEKLSSNGQLGEDVFRTMGSIQISLQLRLFIVSINSCVVFIHVHWDLCTPLWVVMFVNTEENAAIAQEYNAIHIIILLLDTLSVQS
jgi:hypothetical protein